MTALDDPDCLYRALCAEVERVFATHVPLSDTDRLGDDDFTFHTLSTDTKSVMYDPSCRFSVHFRKHVQRCGVIDEYFAAAEAAMDNDRPGLVIFASKDDSVVGACHSVQTDLRSRKSIYVTLVNSTLTGRVLCDIFEACQGDLGFKAFDGHVQHMVMKKVRQKSLVDARHLQIAIDNSVRLMSEGVQRIVHGMMYPSLLEVGKYPDVRGMLDYGGYVTRDAGHGAASLRNGTVLVVATAPLDTTVTGRHDIKFDIRMRDEFNEIGGASFVHVATNPVTKALEIVTIGISMAHVCLMIGTAIELAVQVHSGKDVAGRHKQQLVDILSSVCTYGVRRCMDPVPCFDGALFRECTTV